MCYLCMCMCVCLPYVYPCMSSQGGEFFVHPHVSSSVIYLCATSFVYKSIQKSLWCFEFGNWWKVSTFVLLWLVYFLMNKVNLTRCSVYCIYSTVHTVYVCQIVHLVVLKRSRANHRLAWKTVSVGKSSGAASLESECLSVFAYVSAKNIMEWLIQVVFSV